MSGPRTRSGAPDMRYAVNRAAYGGGGGSSSSSSGGGSSSRSYSSGASYSSYSSPGPLKSDGTPDMRYSANKAAYGGGSSSSGYSSATSGSSSSTSSGASYSSYSSTGPVKSDGTPDMRYSANKAAYGGGRSSSGGHSTKTAGNTANKGARAGSGFITPTKKDGTPDMRFKSNKQALQAAGLANSPSSPSDSAVKMPVKKDGTPDMRFTSNKQTMPAAKKAGLASNTPVKKDGTPDMRYTANKLALITAKKAGLTDGHSQGSKQMQTKEELEKLGIKLNKSGEIDKRCRFYKNMMKNSSPKGYSSTQQKQAIDFSQLPPIPLDFDPVQQAEASEKIFQPPPPQQPTMMGTTLKNILDFLNIVGKMENIEEQFLEPAENARPIQLNKKLVAYSDSVGIIESPEVVATVFRVGKKYVMTSLHTILMLLGEETIDEHTNFDCLADNNDIYVSFNKDEEGSTVKKEKLRPTVTCYNPSLDVCILELELPEGSTQHSIQGLGHLIGSPDDSKQAILIGHPFCGIKKQNDCNLLDFDVLASIIKDKFEPSVCMYEKLLANIEEVYRDENNLVNEDIVLMGSSGSPVFDNNGKLIALHTAISRPDWDPDARIQHGYRMDSIKDWMEKHHATLAQEIFTNK